MYKQFETLDMGLSVLYATITGLFLAYPCRFRFPSGMEYGTEIETENRKSRSSSPPWN